MDNRIWIKHGPGKRLIEAADYDPDRHELFEAEKPKRTRKRAPKEDE